MYAPSGSRHPQYAMGECNYGTPLVMLLMHVRLRCLIRSMHLACAPTAHRSRPHACEVTGARVPVLRPPRRAAQYAIGECNCGNPLTSSRLRRGLTLPHRAAQYAIGECNYGGRVTDDKDRRLLTTLLARIYCPEIMQQEGFQLSESGLYSVPPDGDLQTYVR